MTYLPLRTSFRVQAWSLTEIKPDQLWQTIKDSIWDTLLLLQDTTSHYSNLQQTFQKLSLGAQNTFIITKPTHTVNPLINFRPVTLDPHFAMSGSLSPFKLTTSKMTSKSLLCVFFFYCTMLITIIKKVNKIFFFW